MQVLNLEEIKSEYSFLFEDSEENKEIYFCNCGEITERNKKIEKHVNYLFPETQTTVSETPITNLMSTKDEDDDYFDLYKSIQLSQDDDGFKCSGCDKNFATLENQNRLIVNNSFFVSGYNILDNESELFLYYGKLRANIIKNTDGKYVLAFDEKIKYIKYDKLTKKTFFQDFDSNEIEFDLDGIIKITDNIFSEEIKNIYNLYHIQVYIGKLAKYVIDINNTNIIEELLSETKNRFNYAGLDVIKKAISIFFGIIKYSNLSTIALTKGCKFLYDLMKECDIPSVKKLTESGLTSPIPIFNHLVSNYIKKVNEEVNEDNKEIHEFLFKSSQMIKMDIDESDKKQEAKNFEIIDGEEKEMKIVYKENKDYKTKVTHNADVNKFHVMEISNDANASKFIYKNIKNFSDYKQLLKYFKFYDKHQIITLLQKYEIDLLTRVIDLVYFRDSVDIKEFERIITIIKDFITQETLAIKPTLNMENFKPDYSFVSKFEFIYYDDSIMMMEVLGFDPRREFNKIKTHKELMDYHNNLVKYFNVVSDKEKNAKFKSFVARFKFLEDRGDYVGPLELKLIETPAMLIAEGVQMKHSAGSYSKKVITESYIIGQIFDRTPGLPAEDLNRFTIGFTFDSVNGLEFHQVKGIMNKPGTDRFKKLLMEYLTEKDISFRPIMDLKLRNE